MADDGNGNRSEEQNEPSSAEERARKQARVRGMTDPLGSLGFRETPRRYRREALARRGVFGGAAASFVIGTALIIAANERGAESTPAGAATAAPTSQVVSTQEGANPQPATSNISQPTAASGEAEAGAGASSTGLSGGESTELLVKSRPGQQATNSGDDDRYDDDDEHEDDDDRYEDDEHEDDDDDDYESSSVVQNQGNQSSSAGSVSGNQSAIVVPNAQPHTQTSSTRD